MAVQIENNEILDFVEYVDAFYNPETGVFPIKGATIEVITKAIKTYVGAIHQATTWGGGDSVDRERVRDIILQNNPQCEVGK
jgi:arabinogalactan endo-1,4-beta-galactosidase